MRPPEGPNKIGAMQHALFRLLPSVPFLIDGVFYLGRFLYLNASRTFYRLIVRWASPADRRTLLTPYVRQDLIDGVGEGLRPGIRGLVEEMRIFSRHWDLPFDAIKAPVLMWQCTQDRNVPLSAALRLAEIVPNCELTCIDDAGHYWIFEHIDDGLKVIKQKVAGQLAALERRMQIGN